MTDAELEVLLNEIESDRVERKVAPTDGDLAVFAHLLDSDGVLVNQDDRLGVPSWQWEAGDRFAQVQWLDLSVGIVLHEHKIALGVYDRDTLGRLQVSPCGSESGGSESGASQTTAPDNGATMTRVLLPIEEQIP